jgi:hypothetical protein
MKEDLLRRIQSGEWPPGVLKVWAAVARKQCAS